MINIFSAYSPRFPRTAVYMLQASEYKTLDYVKWLNRTADFSAVAKRRQLDPTAKARVLLLVARLIFVSVFVVAIGLGVFAFTQSNPYLMLVSFAVLLLAPVITAYGLVIPLVLGYYLVQKPKQKKIIAAAKVKLHKHKGLKIAIAGSYGKTTFREQLNAVLSAGKKTSATPANFNTPLGISTFASRLKGDEEVLILEFGEHYRGDVRELCELVSPDMGVITGINESHLEKFKTIENTVATIFELQDYLGDKPLYKNKESNLVADRIDSNDPLAFDSHGCNGWVVTDIKVSLDGTSFVATKGRRKVEAETKLLGQHIVGVLTGCIAIAEELGLTDKQIEKGVAATEPFEHRMQPRQVNGAVVIDDTYNGNIDGVKAGLALLRAVDANRKIYVTPGLVEQGSETARVHELMGQLIAESADAVYLMSNSTTVHIKKGLEAAEFAGPVTVIDDPLDFYTHLERFVAKGDVVLMQNDWTDNYH